ncbi:hypothetical protein [Georgenia alba]|uniref:LPXTG cell wall anchor domain-containing protein n=1 Tax=Georgenia alba TaxID=2233858 RepID=A0ABW2Q5G5_9MICO
MSLVRRARPAGAVAVLGALLLVGGVVRVLTTPEWFAWSARAQLSGESFAPGLVVLDRSDVLPMCLAVLGLILLAGALGYLLGARRRGRASA